MAWPQGGIELSASKKLMMSASGIDWNVVQVGDFIEGGYFAGRISFEGFLYALIVSPSAGQSSARQWKTALTSTFNTSSYYDGWANTLSMMASSEAHPAAEFCRSLNINGFTDWYLPARNELEIIYRALKPSTNTNNALSGQNPNAVPPTSNYTSGSPPQTTVDIFKLGQSEAITLGRVWSSTQADSYRAWCQWFQSGEQIGPVSSSGYSDKIAGNAVRAIRRVLIE